MTYSRIAGTGRYLPEKILTNADLEKIVDTTDEWIRTRTGVERRHCCAPDQTTSDMCIEAAKIAVEFDMASTYSDNRDLTNKLLSEDFFEVETYPHASFISTGIKLFPDGNYSVTGNLELHDVKLAAE